MKQILSLIIGLSLVSCNTLKQDVHTLTKVNKEIESIKKPLEEKSKTYVDAAIEILKKDKITNELTLRLLLNAQTIIGIPDTINKLNIEALINKEPQHLSILSEMEKTDNTAIKKLKVLEIKKEELKDKIIEKTKEELQTQKSWWQKLKDGVIRYFLITGIILFLLFVGPSILKAVFNVSLSFTPFGFLRNLFK